ncbi:TolC family protein [Caulifigura coniformis]|nr:TolC family protein [Caulifigura coniformis]
MRVAPEAPAIAASPIPETDLGKATDDSSPADSDQEPLSDIRLTAAEEDTVAGSPSVSLQYLESVALANNPAIRQASAAAYKAMGARQQVGLLPNPTVGYFGEQLGDAGTDQHGVSLTQTIVLGDKLALNACVLSQSVQAQLWELEAQRYRVLTDVRLRYYDAMAAQQRLRAAEEFIPVAQRGVEIARSRKEAAEGAQPEVLQAEIQQNELELLQQRATYAFQAAWKELSATVGQPRMLPTELAVPNPPSTDPRDWEDAYNSIVARSPELRAANSRIARASMNLRRQQAQPIPNLELQLGFGRDLGTDSEFGRVQAGMPIPVFNDNRGNISTAEAEYCRAFHDRERLQMSVRARLARAAQEFDSARAAVRRYDEAILPKASESLRLSEQAYETGEFNFLQVLIARRTYFDTTLQAIDARRELAQAAATVDGLLLSGGLADVPDAGEDDSLRGQALDGQ